MEKFSNGVACGKRTVAIAGNSAWRDGGMTTHLLDTVTATVCSARTRGAALLGLSPQQLHALGTIADARAMLEVCIGRLTAAGIKPDEAVSLVVASAVEAAAGREGASAASFVAATWRACRTELRRERSFARRHVRPTLVDESALAEAPLDVHGRLLLAWAVETGILSAHEAKLIATTRGAGYPLASIAAASGLPVSSLASLRRRAENRLRTALEHAEDQS